MNVRERVVNDPYFYARVKYVEGTLMERYHTLTPSSTMIAEILHAHDQMMAGPTTEQMREAREREAYMLRTFF